jgi:nucleotide-binding universal stress UspA family protein
MMSIVTDDLYVKVGSQLALGEPSFERGHTAFESLGEETFSSSRCRNCMLCWGPANPSCSGGRFRSDRASGWSYNRDRERVFKMADSSTGLIVVGADGSPLSIGALQWAARQASFTGADVHVVTGFYIPITIFLVPTYTDADYARDAQSMLDYTIEKAFESQPPKVRVTTALIEERPAQALTGVAAANDADLLVVGSHGQGEVLPGMHLGSVAGYCVHHAPCPVLVYRGEHTGR